MISLLTYNYSFRNWIENKKQYFIFLISLIGVISGCVAGSALCGLLPFETIYTVFGIIFIIDGGLLSNRLKRNKITPHFVPASVSNILPPASVSASASSSTSASSLSSVPMITSSISSDLPSTSVSASSSSSTSVPSLSSVPVITSSISSDSPPASVSASSSSSTSVPFLSSAAVIASSSTSASSLSSVPMITSSISSDLPSTSVSASSSFSTSVPSLSSAAVIASSISSASVLTSSSSSPSDYYKTFSKRKVVIPNYTHARDDSEWVGYIHDSHDVSQSNIVKYHLSIAPDSMETALPLLLNLLIKHRIRVFKIIKREHLHDTDYLGREVVIYFYNDDSPKKAEIFLKETCSTLHGSGIKKGAEVPSDLSVDGTYCYFRADRNVWENYFSTYFLSAEGFTKEEAACLNPKYIRATVKIRETSSSLETEPPLSPKFEGDLHKHESISSLSDRIYNSMIQKLNENFLKLIIGDVERQRFVFDKNAILYFFLCREEYFSAWWNDVTVRPTDIERIQLEKMTPTLKKAAYLAAYLHLSLGRDPSIPAFGNILPAVYHKMLIPWKARFYSKSMTLFDSKKEENDFIKAAALCILRKPNVPYPKPVSIMDSALNILIEQFEASEVYQFLNS